MNRDERLAKNEALFRDVNERVRQISAGDRAEDVTDFLCECVDVECLARVTLSLAAYERVRSDPTHFFMHPGHEDPEIETVIERLEGYVVVEKDPETHHVVQDSDPPS
jgi:hypothetical protein